MKKVKTEKMKPFTVRSLGESTISAIKHRAIDEGRTVQSVCSDALIAYLATPYPRSHRSA